MNNTIPPWSTDGDLFAENERVKNLLSKIVLLKEKRSPGGKRHYRYGDVVFHRGFYWKQSTLFILRSPDYHDSILRKYIESSPSQNLNEVNEDYARLLLEIINEKIRTTHISLPENDELVFHLRLGDVCDFDWFLNKNYSQIITDHINSHNISKVTFCGALHFGNNITQNLWIYDRKKHRKNLDGLRRAFSQVVSTPNILIDVKSSKDIDEDFIYMSKSKHFVRDEGGFSQLIEELRRMQNL